jgi:hypothetical protein
LNLPRFHDFAYSSADDIHFFGGEPIASGKVAGSTCWTHIFANVRKGIVNSIKPSGMINRSAINAWLGYKVANLISRHVASVNSLICLAKKNSAPFIGFVVASLSFSNFGFLLKSKVSPTLFPPISALFAGVMAWFAFV